LLNVALFVAVSSLHATRSDRVSGRTHVTSGGPPVPTSVEIARRLIARGAESGNGGEPKSAGAALQRTCVRVAERLRDSMGEDGCNALIARALARTEGGHPALKNIRRLDEGGIYLDGVIASIETYGVVEVTASVEALLASLVDVLARLIGEDMAARIIDDTRPPSNGSGGQAP
jgi:hypothetical protein